MVNLCSPYSDMGRLIANLRAARAEVERLRAEIADCSGSCRLLGPARMVLDRCALNGGDQERQDAADMAQRIVDLIGHPVTDEPPHALVERDRLRDALHFYADPENWQAKFRSQAPADGPNPGAQVWESGPANDGGERARRALNGG